MRIIPLGIAAIVLAAASFSAPAFAQYGGSPDQQIDAPDLPGGKIQQGDTEDDVDAMAGPDDDYEAYGQGGPDDRYDPAGQGDSDDGYEQGESGAQDDAYDPGETEGPRQYGEPDADDRSGSVDNDRDYDEESPRRDEGAGQGEDGRTCRRSDGTTGLVVGGGAGALVGRGFDRHGERTTGTILGAIAGALIGSAVERNSCR